MSIMKKSKSSHAYLLAKGKIQDLISRENYKPGDLIPSINSFTKGLKTGRRSVQRAIELLEKEGVLETVRGSGSFVKTLPSAMAAAGNPPARPSLFADENFSIRLASGRVTVKIALFQAELEYFGDAWRKTFLEYQTENPEIEIETIEVSDVDDLNNKIRGGKADIFQLSLDILPSYVDSGYLFNPSAAGKIDISGNVYFKSLLDASTYNGVLWGMPLAANTTCLYFNKRYKKNHESIFPVEGFWNFFEKLEGMADGEVRQPLPAGIESFILNDYAVSDIFLHCSSDLSDNALESGGVYGLPKYCSFIKRFEKYYRNGKIFSPVTRNFSEKDLQFTGGRFVMALATSSWIPSFLESRFNSWSIAPLPVEKNGFAKLFGVLNTISSMTYHPSECLDLLNFLGRTEVQKNFALAGRLVANKEACRCIKIKNLDGDSVDNLLKPFETGRVMRKKNFYESDFDSKVFYPEMLKWHSGLCTSEEFLNTVQKKRELFYNAQKLRISFAADPRRISIPA